jgi:hypothetical protein
MRRVRDTLVPHRGIGRHLLRGVRRADAGAAGAEAVALAGTAETAGVRGRCGMSALPCVLATTHALAEATRPVWRSKPIEGLAFYRRHCLGLLGRYLRASMEIGRAPCVLGNVVFRGKVSSYRLSSFEDIAIFVFDVEKCLKQLDSQSQAVVAHVALEDFTVQETAAMMGESERSVARVYGEALDKLTRLFLEFGLLDPKVENLSRGEGKNRSNND